MQMTARVDWRKDAVAAGA
jgi:hypothetical protein